MLQRTLTTISKHTCARRAHTRAYSALATPSLARTLHATPRLAREHTRESLDEEVRRLAEYKQTSVSLKATLDTGLGLLLPDQGKHTGLSSRQRTLIQIASFLKRELPVRLARRVLELKEGPEGIGEMPSVVRVRKWYEQSFVEIRRSATPVDLESEEAFHQLLRKIHERHAPTLVTMARGVLELRQSLQAQHGDRLEFGELHELHSFLDAFYTSRIGIRILIGQYLELKKSDPEPGYVGLIYQHTNPAEITHQAIEDARYLCERTHGDAPEVVLRGRSDLLFADIPAHLYYCMLEPRVHTRPGT